MIEAVALIMGARLYDWSGCFDYGSEAFVIEAVALIMGMRL